MVEHDSGTATPRPSGLDRGAFRFHRPSWKRYRTVTKVGAGGAVLDPFLSVVGDVIVRMNDAGVWELEQQFMAAADTPPYWSMMHKVGCPTLLTWGRDDRVSPPDMAMVPMRLIPDAELHIFPKCGHWVMIEAKQAFESAVAAFLAR